MSSESVSWLFVWVPAKRHERETRSSSQRTRTCSQGAASRERSCSQGRKEDLSNNDPRPALPPTTVEEDVNSSLISSDDPPPTRPKEFIITSTSATSNKSDESRPLLERSLPAIQEDLDLPLEPTNDKPPPASTSSADLITTPSTPDTDKLTKQESYDSHVKRGNSTTPITPSTEQMLDETPLTRNVDESPERSFVPFLEFEPMEQVVRGVLAKLGVVASVQPSDDGRQVLFTFALVSDVVEDAMQMLTEQGVGHTETSSISVVPASIYCHNINPRNSARNSLDKEDKLDKFYASVKSRLHVAEVMARITAGAQFSFDFLLLLILAGAIAFMGLLENSSVVLVASMLVSPLMGPILAGIFGCVVRDWKLTWKGIRHETEALLIVIGLGYVLGLLICPWIDWYNVPQWPTQQMLDRGELRDLWVGVLIAVPSGAGVALSVLGGNAGSLVGVAISASLLPPAVNAGLLWAMATILAAETDHTSLSRSQAVATSFHGFGVREIEFKIDNNTVNLNVTNYQQQYSDNPSTEAFLLGLVSLGITLVNIVCIIITGVLILKLKEVTPAKIPQKFSNFWKRDIPTHRQYLKPFKKGRGSGDQHQLLADVRSEMAAVLGEDLKMNDPGLQGTFLQSMFDRAVVDEDLINIRQWVALAPAIIEPTNGNNNDNDRFGEFHAGNNKAGDYSILSPYSGSTAYGDLSPQVMTWGARGPMARGRLTRMHSYNAEFLNLPGFFEKELKRSKDFRSGPALYNSCTCIDLSYT